MSISARQEKAHLEVHRRRTVAARVRADDGQAAVELVALLPLLALVAAVVWQLALAGHATWAAGAAARAGARAEALGRDPRPAARSALPSELRPGLRVTKGADAVISVHVRIPAVTPGLELGHASARAHFPAQGA